MKTTQVIAAVRKHTGIIYVGMLCRNDVVYVRAVKSDLLNTLQRIADNEIEYIVENGDLFIDSALAADIS